MPWLSELRITNLKVRWEWSLLIYSADCFHESKASLCFFPHGWQLLPVGFHTLKWSLQSNPEPAVNEIQPRSSHAYSTWVAAKAFFTQKSKTDGLILYKDRECIITILAEGFHFVYRLLVKEISKEASPFDSNKKTLMDFSKRIRSFHTCT